MAVRKEFIGSRFFEYYDILKTRLLINGGYQFGLYVLTNPITRNYFERRGAELTKYETTGSELCIKFEYGKIKL